MLSASAPVSLVPPRDVITAAPLPLAWAVVARAIRHRPPQGQWRVLVGVDPDSTLAEPYLRVRARVVGRTGETDGDPRFHVRLPLDTHGLPTPHRADDADLVMLARVDVEVIEPTLRAVANALSASGIAVLGVPSSEQRLSALVAATGLELRERARVGTAEGSFDLLVVADRREAVPLPLRGLRLDRSACVDREMIRDALAHGPWSGPDPSRPAGSTTALLAALRQQLERGEPDVERLPWPRDNFKPVTNTTAGCDVLAVMPHPDDESVYAGGTLAGLTAAGQRVHLVVATDGAGGRGGGALGRRRAREVITAAKILGVQSLRCLAWEDFGKYRDAARTLPVSAGDAIRAWGLHRALSDLVAEIRRARPECLLSLGPRVDPNLSLHGHHLGLGVLSTIAFVAAADPGFAPELGPAWSCAEHRVLAPLAHARGGEVFEVNRTLKRRALAAHTSQAYSTEGLLRDLGDEDRAAVEVTRKIQSRRPRPWILARSTPSPAPTIDWNAEARRVRAAPRPRAAVVEALRRQAEQLGVDGATERSLATLAREDGVAVVTGQQVGLLGGPVYTLAKALEAVALARRLQRAGIPAAPVFWLASQDHDLAEVQRVPRLGAPPLDLGLEPDGRPVGERRLGPAIEGLLDRWAAELDSELDRPALAELVALLRRTHRPAHDFAQAFTELLRALTRGTGLLVLDPTDPALARLAHPLLTRALAEASAVEDALAHARRRLGGREVIATHPGRTQVFAVDDRGVRKRIVHAPGRPVDLRVFDVLDEYPERASPAALLRPLVQDALLPTIAYVAGPTEQRYLAQLDELYRWAELPSPRIVRRPSLHLHTARDIEPLVEAGGLARLQQSERPHALIGRDGLGPAASRWLEELDALIERLDAVRRRPSGTFHPRLRTTELAERRARLDELARRALPTLGRVQRHWSTIYQDLRLRFELTRLCPTAHAITRLRHELVRLRRSLLRDGRRARPRALAAWRRVGSEPAAAERRMTVAEWIARGGLDLVPIVLRRLEAEPCAEVTLYVGDL
ncbi:MAG: bacillithiol biosynthesis BshC [Myxococcota bacterium]